MKKSTKFIFIVGIIMVMFILGLIFGSCNRLCNTSCNTEVINVIDTLENDTLTSDTDVYVVNDTLTVCNN